MRDASGMAVFGLEASAQPQDWAGVKGIRSEFEELPPEACTRRRTFPSSTYPGGPGGSGLFQTALQFQVHRFPHLQDPSVQTFSSSGPHC